MSFLVFWFMVRKAIVHGDRAAYLVMDLILLGLSGMLSVR
jgi:hypothetical protein